MIHRFIEGLPDQLAFFIRASNVQSLRDALHMAKMNTAASNPKPRQTVSEQRSCYKCEGAGHLKSKCNWTGQGQKSMKTQCQLCYQLGDSAKYCRVNPLKKKLDESNIQQEVKCQICEGSHTAKDCPQLNLSGLGPMRTFQA